MANRENTFLLKRSNIPGKVPAPGDLRLGELALNTADGILYTSGDTSNSILPIGWDRISRTGDTVTGDFIFNDNITVSGVSNFNIVSATTIYGDGSNLTNIDNFYTTGATFSGNTIIFGRTDNVNAYTIDLSPKLSGSFGITIDGSNSVITSGNKGYLTIPYGGVITGWQIISDQVGSCSIDVWKASTGNIPTVIDTIVGTEKPILSTQQIASDLSLTSWVTSVAIGDVFAFNVDSNSIITRINLSIFITKQ